MNISVGRAIVAECALVMPSEDEYAERDLLPCKGSSGSVYVQARRAQGVSGRVRSFHLCAGKPAARRFGVAPPIFRHSQSPSKTDAPLLPAVRVGLPWRCTCCRCRAAASARRAIC